MKITFTPHGLGQCLYTELIDLTAIGRLRIKRATNIEFDNNRQAWRVKDVQGKALYESSSRQACLDWERHYFNQDKGSR